MGSKHSTNTAHRRFHEMEKSRLFEAKGSSWKAAGASGGGREGSPRWSRIFGFRAPVAPPLVPAHRAKLPHLNPRVLGVFGKGPVASRKYLLSAAVARLLKGLRRA